MLPFFTETDFNWNTTPSNHKTADFQKAREKIKKRIGAKIVVYNLGDDDREIKEFIKTHFASGAPDSIKSPITKDNFVQIFIKWVKAGAVRGKTVYPYSQGKMGGIQAKGDS
jgi:hypothetical protein